MNDPARPLAATRALRHLRTFAGALLLTAMFFFVLPLTQVLGQRREDDLLLREVETSSLPPPPPPPEPEPEEPEEPEPPPELQEEQMPLDLAQLELALNPSLGAGMLAGDFTQKLESIGNRAAAVESLFSLADLDQKPRPIVQTSPVMTPQMRKRAPVTVYLLMVVDEQGRVVDPVVQTPGDSLFDSAAFAAIKQWRYEPGQRKGAPVRFRLRQPITFPKN